MSSGMYFPESPAKCLFLPCFHALKLLRAHCSSVHWDGLPAEVILVLLTKKFQPSSLFSVQLIYASFRWLYLYCLSRGPSHCYLRSSHPSLTVAFVHFWILSVEYSVEWTGYIRLSRLVCHRPSATVVAVVAEITLTKVKLLKNTCPILHIC